MNSKARIVQKKRPPGLAVAANNIAIETNIMSVVFIFFVRAYWYRPLALVWLLAWAWDLLMILVLLPWYLPVSCKKSRHGLGSAPGKCRC